MKILAIETSCDETAVSIVEADGGFEHATFRVLANQLLSQAVKHREYGGVYPTLAKREHSRNLVPLLKAAFKEAGFENSKSEVPNHKQILNKKLEKIEQILEREPELYEQFVAFIPTTEKPPMDAIAVTHGPGLEPALWVGVNFAKALSLVWDIPLIPVNHMEGHIFAALLQKGSRKEFLIANIQFPILALLISGGHTELVFMKNFGEYELVGQTRDDAVGEAFDKVARMLSLPYPGGPEISKLAESARSSNILQNVRGSSVGVKLPRPMIESDDCDFSFSGLKTAVLYYLKDKKITDELRSTVALEFENAVTEVLLAKARRARDDTGAKMLVLGGGVAANKNIQREFTKAFEGSDINLRIPPAAFTTDNALMIAVAGFYRALAHTTAPAHEIRAVGNLKLVPETS